jgi:hypothetical protein
MIRTLFVGIESFVIFVHFFRFGKKSASLAEQPHMVPLVEEKFHQENCLAQSEMRYEIL